MPLVITVKRLTVMNEKKFRKLNDDFVAHYYVLFYYFNAGTVESITKKQSVSRLDSLPNFPEHQTRTINHISRNKVKCYPSVQGLKTKSYS